MRGSFSTFLYICVFFHSALGAGSQKVSQCEQVVARLGSSYSPERQEINFGLHSPNAERVELHVYADPLHKNPVAVHVMERDPSNPSVWRQTITADQLKKVKLMDQHADGQELDRPVYYGFRLWGPNWKYFPDWKPGSEIGFIADVDKDGNRFNPNKLVFDPRALEISHDPLTPRMKDESVYVTGPEHRAKDSGPFAPKGIVLNHIEKNPSAPLRPFKDEIIYETHLRGLTMNDPDVPAEERGTYKGAIRKIPYLKDLGITAIELLPIQEFQNQTNLQRDTSKNNYWGYMTNGFFAPERRYATKAAQKEHGGVTKEFQAMTKAFNDAGIDVIVDFVYNHTGEGGAGGKEGEYSKILSMRGIDNPGYYQVAGDKRYYKDNTGCGANFNCANPHSRDFINDSLEHFAGLGVRRGRFDLASILGNVHPEGNSFHFDKMPADNSLNRILKIPNFGAIAEPWGIGDNSYQVGGFPHHPDTGAFWAEWNGPYRDTMRKVQNQFGYNHPAPGEIALRMAGSTDYFGNGRKPFHSVNFMAAHDGFTLADIYRYNEKQNHLAPPFGPSDGGEDHNNSWNQAQEGDNFERTLARQRQAARVGFALPLLSFGVPMFNGGDEFLRTQRGNNNMWNVDSKGSWIDWKEKDKDNNKLFHDFAKRIIGFRRSQPAMRPSEHFDGNFRQNGLRDISWYQANGRSIDGDSDYMGNNSNSFLAYRLNTEGSKENERSIYVAYNYGPYGTPVNLPPTAPGKQWHWAGDTAAHYEKDGNFTETGKEIPLSTLIPEGHTTYLLDGRAIAVFIEK